MTLYHAAAKPPYCAFCGRTAVQVRFLVAGDDAAICTDCTVAVHERLGPEIWREAGAGLSPRHLFEELGRWIVGQDSAKRILAAAGYRHHHYRQWYWRGYDPALLPKANILLVGPPGSGKTRLVEVFARALAAPFVSMDATMLTQAGYVGEDVAAIAERLVEAAGDDLDQARFGIVHLDGVDKLAGYPSALGRDPSGAGVQESLLALLEGNAVELRRPRRCPRSRQQVMDLDTTNVLFLASGTFEGLDRIVAHRQDAEMAVGFTGRPDALRGAGWLSALEPADLMAFGLLPEFVGRFPIIAPLAPPDEATLLRILAEPEDAPLRQYQALFAMSGVRLDAAPEALRAVAREALRRGTGARGLRAVLEEVLLDVMFDLPSRPDLRAMRLEGGTFTELRPVPSAGPEAGRLASPCNRRKMM